MPQSSSYITIKLSNNFDDNLFQVGALYTYSMIHNRAITIPNQPEFAEATKLFDSVTLPEDNYFELSDDEVHTFKIVPYDKNIMLKGTFKSFRLYTEDTLSFMREYIYSNADHMYTAYAMYNEIKEKMGSDDDMLSIYFDDNVNKPSNTSYYKKALILMNKKNIVVFSPKSDPDVMRIFDDDHTVQVVWHADPYVRFILLSFFKYNVVQYYDSYFSMLAAYVSKYADFKTIVIPDYLKKITNEKINNMNIVYLD